MIIRHKISVFKLCQLCFSNEDLTAPQLEPLSKLCFVFHLINALYRDSYHHHNLSVLVFWHLADFVCKLGLKGSTFNWNVQVQFNVWCRVIELLSDLLIVAKRAFVITRGIMAEYERPSKQLLWRSGMCSAQPLKQSAGVVKQKYIKMWRVHWKGPDRNTQLKK